MQENRYDKRIKLTAKTLGNIAKLDEFKGLWHGSTRMNPQILLRLKSSVIITSSGASTRIEGSKMSDEAVERLLRGLKSRPPKNRDEEEVAGYADLLGRIFDHHGTLKLSENNILHFHDILLRFSTKDRSHRGKYKNADNTVIMKTDQGETIVLFDPTKPYLVKPEMDSIMDWTNGHLREGDLHPVLAIANFIFEFLAIHPFIDGNGRLSRALTNLLLLRSGYAYVPYVSLDEIIESRKERYYLALRATQKRHKTDHEDISPWLEFFLGILLEQADAAKRLMDAEQPEKLLSEKQSMILGLFRSESFLSVSQIHAEFEGKIPLVTIKQSIRRLVDSGLLERMGQGRGVRYRKVDVI